MKINTITELESIFKESTNKGLLFIGVAIKMPNLEKPEIIIHPYSNFNYKMEYYLKAYNENLTLKNNPNIKIIDVFASDYISDIVIALSHVVE